MEEKTGLLTRDTAAFSLNASRTSAVTTESPSHPRILQKDFLVYIGNECRVSKPQALDRLKKMAADGFVFLDSSIPRKKAVVLNLARLVENYFQCWGMLDPGDQPLGVFGVWAGLEDVRARLRSLGLLENCDEDNPEDSFSEKFLEEYRLAKNDLRSRYDPEASHLGALTRIYNELMNPLTLKELVCYLAISTTIYPFNSIEWKHSKATVPESNMYGYTVQEYRENLEHIFEAIGEPYAEPEGGFAKMKQIMDAKVPGWDSPPSPGRISP